MKIAILGGTRFVGPFIVRGLLRDGHAVDVYHRGKTGCKFPDGVHHFTIDRSIKGQTVDALKRNKPDVVIDMCGQHPEHLEAAVDTDLNLRQYIFCSSTVVYGQIGKTTPNESAKIKVNSDYEYGKVACEELLLSIHRERGLPVTILRVAHPYGPGDHLIYSTGRESLFLDRIRQERMIIIPGSGDTRIHPVYVEDCAEAFIHVLDRADCNGRIFNLSGNEILSLNEYFESIARALKKPLVASHIPPEWFDANANLWVNQNRKFDFAPAMCQYETAFDVTALAATGFRCLTNHDQGVAATIPWLDKQGWILPSSDDDLEDVMIELRRSVSK